MKIMRNAIRGLDDAACVRDLAGGYHGVAALERRWTTAAIRNQTGRIEVRFDARWHGDFAQNCYEFSATQRVIYNLLANACRFTVDQTVAFHILGTHEPDVKDVRFVLENPVSASHASVLREQLENGAGLFSDGVTVSGEGLGLGICADFVAAAYGIEDRQTALTGEYLGASLTGNRFTSWFHWPALQVAR